MKNGVPWDVASSFSDEEIMAASVVFGEFEGGKFRWDTLTWEDRGR